MNNLFCTWIDVINEIPQYFDWETGELQEITKSKILQILDFEEKRLKSKLRSYYGNDLSIAVDRFETLNLTKNNNVDFVLDTSYITVTTQFTQVYKFVFTEDSDVTNTVKVLVTPDVGTEVAGDITGTIDLTKISVAVGAWSGYTFYKGDTIYLLHYHYESLLSSLLAKSAASRILERTATSQLSADGPSAQELRREVDDMVKEIQDPYANVLEISLKAQNLDTEEVEYSINDLGIDTTDYLE